MSPDVRYWVVENGDVELGGGALADRSRSWVALHTHSCHSTENIASLNSVVKIWYMRPLARLLQRAFGLAKGGRLDYREVTYHPPFTPEAAMLMERRRAESLSLPGLIFSVTDHDEVAGSLQLVEAHPDRAGSLPIGVELSVPFRDHLFHLGITGLDAATARTEIASLRNLCAGGELEVLFDRLRRLRCLVVLNHPLLPWRGDVCPEERLTALLGRYGEGIDALEFNGMRSIAENRQVLAVAARMAKPVVGGGDSHLLVPSAAGCVTRAECFADFVEEVRAGNTRTVITEDYFAPLGWKLTLRVLSFISHYRAIADFRGRPVAEILRGRRVALDPLGRMAGWFLGAADRLGRLS